MIRLIHRIRFALARTAPLTVAGRRPVVLTEAERIAEVIGE